MIAITNCEDDKSWSQGISNFYKLVYLHPQNVVTPNFYFAIELENHYSWKAAYQSTSITLNRQPGDIWINPPFSPFTHLN